MIKIELILLGKVASQTLDRLGYSFENREQVFFADYSEFDIPRNTLFSKLDGKGESGIDICCELVNITQQYGKKFDLIPKGWKTIVELKFGDSLPALILNLPCVSEWPNNKLSSVRLYNN